MTTTDKLKFTKMTGTGNDFIFIDARGQAQGFPEALDRPLFTKSLCRRTLSIGADGVVFIESSQTPGVDFKWDFYNADGSHAEMCGNAARCAARFAHENKIAGPEASFETASGIIKTKIKNNSLVEVEMAKPSVLEAHLQVPVGEHIKIQVDYIMAGVPHVVRENDDWESEYLHDMGAYLRKQELFKKTNGANATFYEVIDPSRIQAATFERGVEAVTMSCGTGAIAAAFAASLNNGLKGVIEVSVPGGTLFVDLDSRGPSKVLLTGEARFICTGEIRSEALL